MRKALKLLGFLSATLVLFFVVASLAFYHLVRIGEVRRFLVDEIEKQTELKIDLGGADLEIGWITGVVFRNVAVRERDESSSGTYGRACDSTSSAATLTPPAGDLLRNSFDATGSAPRPG